MSSELAIPVQSSELVRLQGGQASAPKAPVEKKQADEVQGKDSAARGQNLPLKQAEQAGDAADVEKVEAAVSQISDFVQNFQRDLQFSIDEDSDRLVVKVVDSETQEVIRQIPSEEMLRIARKLDSTESLILREQA